MEACIEMLIDATSRHSFRSPLFKIHTIRLESLCTHQWAASGFISRQAGHDVRIGEVSRCIQEVMEAGEVPWLTKIADDWVLNCRFYLFFSECVKGLKWASVNVCFVIV